MVLAAEASIVADSTMASSAPPSPQTPAPAPVVRRTYGRRKDTAADATDGEADSSYTLYNASADLSPPSSKYGTLRTAPSHLDEEIPASDNTDVDTVDDDGLKGKFDSFSPTPSSPKAPFVFGWKQKLLDMDMSDDENDAPSIADGLNKRAHVTHAEEDNDDASTRPKQSTTKPFDLANSARPRPGAFASSSSGSSLGHLAPSPTRSPSSPRSPIASVASKSKGRKRRVIEESDSERSDAGPHKSSQPTPALTQGPSFPNSPALSSDHENGDELRKKPVKGKGKAPASAKDPALLFDEELPESSSHPKPEKRKSKTKALSKKEERESQKELARIRAEREAPGIQRTTAKPKPTRQSFFEKMRGSLSLGLPEPAPKTVEPSSDPIQQFTSPIKGTQGDGDQVAQSAFGECSSLLSSRPTAVAGALLLPLPASDDEDDDFPNFQQLRLEQKAMAEKRARLAALKQRALAEQSLQSNRAACPADDDDDLEIEVVPAADAEAEAAAVHEHEEAHQRGLGFAQTDGKKRARIGEGRKRQLQFAVGRPDLTDAHGKPAGKRAAVAAGPTKKELETRLLSAAGQQAATERAKKEEDWKARGGRIKVAAPVPGQGVKTFALEEVLKKGVALSGGPNSVDEDVDDEDVEDGDWRPDDADAQSEGEEDAEMSWEEAEAQAGQSYRGSASPERDLDDGVDADEEAPMDDDMDRDENALPRTRRRRGFPRTAVVHSDSEDEATENIPPAHKRSNTFGTVLVPGTSLVGPDAFAPRVNAFGDDGDSDILEGTDKENDHSLIFDDGEDKENTAIAGHALPASPARPPLGERKGSSLFGLATGLRHGLSMAWSDDGDGAAEQGPVAGPSDLGKTRAPFREISKETLGDDDGADPFTSPRNAAGRRAGAGQGGSFVSLLRSQARGLGSPLRTPAPLFGAKGGEQLGFSQFEPEIENDENAAPAKPAALQGGFADLFEFGTAAEAGPSKATGLDFGTEKPAAGFGKLRQAQELSLTFDAGLEPPLELSATARRKADEIFLKEQEFLVEAALPKPSRQPELYVNEMGFLTQTRPAEGAGEVYQPPTPSQALSRMPSQATQSFAFSQASQPARQPLRTLSLSAEAEFSQAQPLRRLRRRSTTPSDDGHAQGYRSSPSPSPGKPSAFDVMQRAARRAEAKERRAKRALEKSEFVEAEAAESDEDAGFGFGPKKQDEEEEEDGEDQDQPLEGLVDDAVMDADAVAAELVLEKAKEHQEEDDKLVEKKVKDVVEGRMRTKKRDRGIGFEDSESESEDENKVRRPKGLKKRRIDGDSLDALRHDESMAAFVGTYDNDLADDNTEFAFLAGADDDMDEDQDQENQPPPKETVSLAEFQQELREAARKPKERPHFDVENVDYVDRDDSDEDSHIRFQVVTKVKPKKRSEGVAEGAAENDGFGRPFTKQEMEKSTAWAAGEGRSRAVVGGARSVGGVAVTGHGRAKAAAGSVRGVQRAAAGSSESSRRPAKAPSMLSAVSDRRSRFGN